MGSEIVKIRELALSAPERLLPSTRRRSATSHQHFVRRRAKDTGSAGIAFTMRMSLAV